MTRHVVWLRRAVPRTRTGAGTAADAIVSALRHLGPARLEAAVLARVPITDGPVS